MGETDRWYGLPSAGERFSSAPPAAFGFLGAAASPITIDGSNLTSLGNTVSLVGGGLSVTNGAQITIDGGRFDMAAVASPGEVVPGPDGLDVSSFDALADIAITGNSLNRPSGIGVNAGSIFIRGGRFVMDNSEILAAAPFSVAEQPESVVDIRADSVALNNGALLSTDTFGRVDGADIKIQARDAVDVSGAVIRVGSYGVRASGDAGELTVAAREISLGQGTLIQSESREQSTGNAGNVTLRAGETVTVSDTKIDTFTTGTGNAGRVSVIGEAVRLDTGADIRAYTKGSGNAGSVSVEAGRSVVLTGDAAVSAYTEGSGDAGKVSIAAGRAILLTGEAAVSTETKGAGRAGVIELNADEILLEKTAAVSSSSLAPGGPLTRDDGNSGDAGTIRVTSGTRTVLKDDAVIETETRTASPAGNIVIAAGRFEMDGAVVSSGSTASTRGGDAGTIGVAAGDTVHTDRRRGPKHRCGERRRREIAVTAGTGVHLLDSRISTSVATGGGGGGDIRIGDARDAGAPDYVVLNRSTLTANADQGDGGAIFITTENYFKSPDSVVEATSRRGNDGTIQITAPHLDLIGGLTVLPANFMDASRWVKTPCDVQPAARMSRFVHREGRDGIPQAYDDWLPSAPAVIPQFLARDENPEARACLALLNRGDFAGVVDLLPGDADDPVGAAVRAHALMAVGHYRSALSALYGALPAARKTAGPAVQALFQNLLGDLYLCLGNLQGAIETQKKAVTAAEASGDPLMVSAALNQMGNVRAVADNFDGAAAAYDEGLAAISGVPDAGILRAVLLLNKARVRMAEVRETDARGLLHRAAAALPPKIETYAAAADWISLGMLRERGSRARTDEAGADFARAMAIGRKLANDRILSTALGRQGRLDEAAGRYGAAMDKTRQAMSACRGRVSPRDPLPVAMADGAPLPGDGETPRPRNSGTRRPLTC